VFFVLECSDVIWCYTLSLHDALPIFVGAALYYGGGKGMGKIKKVHVVIISALLLILAFVFHWLDIDVWKKYTLIASTIIAGYSTVKTAMQSIRLRVYFSIELLVTIAVVGELIIGESVEAAAVTFLFLFGAYLEARTIEKTRSSLRTLMDMAPEEATVIKNGEHVTVPVEEINEGDRVVIQSGEKVAVDG